MEGFKDKCTKFSGLALKVYHNKGESLNLQSIGKIQTFDHFPSLSFGLLG